MDFSLRDRGRRAVALPARQVRLLTRLTHSLEACAREVELALSDQAARVLRVQSDATPHLQALGRYLMGDIVATNELAGIAKAMAAVGRELRPAVRHVPKAPPRPSRGASLAELQQYQADREAHGAQENGA